MEFEARPDISLSLKGDPAQKALWSTWGGRLFGDRVLILAGNGQLDIADIEEVHIYPGHFSLVHEIGAVYPDEAGRKNCFPPGDGRVILEMTTLSGNYSGDIIVGLDIDYFVYIQLDLLPLRIKRNRVIATGEFLIQPGFEDTATGGKRGQDKSDKNWIGQDVWNILERERQIGSIS